jgi:hypothetical protein
MGKYSAKGGEDFKPVSAGAHPAVCTMVADVGVQPSNNPAFNAARKIVFRFEIGDERVTYHDKDGKEQNKPAIIYDTLTASMNKKANLRAMLEGWRGQAFTDAEAEDFDTKDVLGKPCMISVVHKESGGKTYANISAVMRLPRGMEAPKAEAKPVYFHIDDDDRSYADLPDWIKKKVDGAISEKPPAPSRAQADERMATQRQETFEDDDIPF